MNFSTFVKVGIAYGCTRKSIHVIFHDPKINVSQKYDVDKRETVYVNRSMLLTEKLSTVVAHTALSGLYWPYFATKDIIALDAKISNVSLTKQDHEYLYDEHIFHILN